MYMLLSFPEDMMSKLFLALLHRKSSAYHWKSGQAGPMTIQARVLSQSKEKNNKVIGYQYIRR